MSTIKSWNPATSQWEVIVVGKQGPTGPQGPAGAFSVITSATPVTIGSNNNEHYIYIVTGQFTITLPTAISNKSKYTIKNKNISNITIQTTSAQTIDGTTTISLAPNESVDLISDNSNWSII